MIPARHIPWGIAALVAALILLLTACESPTPTPAPTPPPSPTPTPEPTPEPTAVERLAWFDAPTDAPHWVAWSALRRMAIDDEPLSQQIASLGWVIDGITAEEAGALDDVSWLLRENPDIAVTALNLPWMATNGDITPDDRRALRAIRSAADPDTQLGAALAAYGWLSDGVTTDEADALETLGEIVAPGFTTQTATGIGAMRLDRSDSGAQPSISQGRLEFALSLSQFSWMQDDVTSPESEFIANLSEFTETVGSHHADAVDTIASYDWVQDGIAPDEPDTLDKLVEAISNVDSPDPTFLGEFLRVDWLQDEVGNAEFEAIGAWHEFISATGTIGSPAAQTVWTYDWTRDDVTSTEIAFLRQLTGLTRTIGDFHAESLDIVASYGWIADGIDGTETAFLRRLEPLFEQAGTEDAGALQTVLGYAWITDGVIVAESASVRRISYLFNASSQEDAQAVLTIADYPWLADSADDLNESDALQAFEALLSLQGGQYVAPQETILAFDWVSDGIGNYDDPYELDELWSLVETVVLLGKERPELMISFVESDWVRDGLSEEERQSLYKVRDVIFQARVLARFAGALPYPVNDELISISFGDEWLQGQFTDSYRKELGETQRKLLRLVPLVRRAASALEVAPDFAWLQDGLSLVEMEWLAALDQLFYVIGQPKALNFAALPWFQDEIDRFNVDIMWSFWPGLLSSPEIAAQEWFRDGISEHDAILVMALVNARNRSSSQYQNLLRQSNLAQRTLTLPLAGDIELYVVRQTEFPLNDPTLDLMEQITPQLEEFMGVPFPLDAAVILIIEPDIAAGEDPQNGVAYALGAHIEMVAPLYNEGVHLAVFHEMSHLYWGGHTGAPGWWIEGAAGFLPDYTRHQLGQEDIEIRRQNLLSDTRRECWNQGIPNITVFYRLQRTDPLRARDRNICTYALGEIFLVEMYRVLGFDATSAAMRQLYVDARDSGWLDPITDQKIYDAFRANTPDDRFEEFRKLFLRLHGGANVDLSEPTP